jgi:mono/diheme cytochrome c family protein
MKKTLLFTLLAVFLFACSNSGDNKEGSTAEASKPAVDGEKIYKTYCVTCHGLYGDMGASGAFNLQTSTLSMAERIDVITNGREGKAMTPFKGLLSEEKIEAVAKYIETLRK